MSFRATPRHDSGWVKPGGKMHAVEHDHTEYDVWAICGASCHVVDRAMEFDLFDPFACKRCAAGVWRGTGPWVRPA